MVPPEVCGVTTPSVRMTPSTPVNENGAVIGVPSSVSCAFGTLLSMRTTEVSGRTSTDEVCVRPDESRTVRITR